MTAIHGTRQMAALADPTRRRILELLSVRPGSVREVADRLPVTRSAVSQHLGVLKRARLVSHSVEGTRHIYHINPQGLAMLRAYLDRLWDRALEGFKEASQQKENRSGKR
jgi:DNA-binding transcriptional ArsR family regulator